MGMGIPRSTFHYLLVIEARVNTVSDCYQSGAERNDFHSVVIFGVAVTLRRFSKMEFVSIQTPYERFSNLSV